MKNRYIITLAMSLFFSCDILEPEPQQSLDAATALSDAQSANLILAGTYSLLQDTDYYGLEYPLNSDLLADNAVFEGFFDSQLELDQKAVPITNLFITNIWPDIYVVVNTANLLIANVPDIDDPGLDNDAVLGEAHAIRALAYFDLLRYFGEHYDTASTFGIPLLLEPIPNNDFNQVPDLPRSTVAETYDQIISDLNIAIPLLEGNSDVETMNYWAALSLRARVNLYRGAHQQAFDDADAVISSGPFILEPNLDDVFFTTDPSDESIFEVVFNEQDQSSFNTYLYRRDEYNVDADLLASFEDGDLRANYFTELRGRDRSMKYDDNTNANNFKVFRLAELYLIRAEAAVFATNDPDAGTADINAVRERAGLPPIASIASIPVFLDALLYERRAELNFEGHRFFDLVRLDRAETVLNLEGFRQILPLPRTELQVSEALTQNPGYATD
ncbi:RagB/SusD family nutrient uptake outer membrane protein [Maribacter sp. 2307ULW6-5]|uniref:RagB/SusD family nutrient uptake outer membrane protein n=1 Tax=Maribacter sp. 2307ULW6-5 TaxID=3386275 RepID=UPI0039BC26D2